MNRTYLYIWIAVLALSVSGHSQCEVRIEGVFDGNVTVHAKFGPHPHVWVLTRRKDVGPWTVQSCSWVKNSIGECKAQLKNSATGYGRQFDVLAIVVDDATDNLLAEREKKYPGV